MNSLRPTDRGETLIESLISLIIMGTVIAALLGGLASASELSASHRKDTTADSVLRAFTEAIKTAPYVVAATTSSYTVATAQSNGFSPVTGYTPSVTQVRCLTSADASGNANTSSGTDFVACTSIMDQDVQLISAQVAYNSGALQTVTILKRKP
jgi:type II secretory pathway pseudopilin PulG